MCESFTESYRFTYSYRFFIKEVLEENYTQLLLSLDPRQQRLKKRRQSQRELHKTYLVVKVGVLLS